jgi:hypothetical protein
MHTRNMAEKDARVVSGLMRELVDVARPEGIGCLVAARQRLRARGLRGGGLRGTHSGGDGALARRVKRATTWRMDLSQPVECHERFPAVGWRRRIALLSAFVAALLLPKGWSRNSMT